ncbi:MAG TPA: hypothetical protein VHO43_17645 [Ignavibacteriales bacterium]|nr:hypothetical protein [Ignavibacteriales bacterium]
MNIGYIIVDLAWFVWLLPPFRQYKGNFFYYFLIMGLSDPVGMFLRYLHISYPYALYAFVSGVLLVSVIAINNKIRWAVILPFLAGTLALGLFYRQRDIGLITAANFIILFFYVVRYVTVFASKYRYVSFFHILLLVYNASLIFKMINFVLDYQKGLLYFFFSSAFGIAVAILFCIFREEDKRFSVKLSGPEESEVM